MYTSSFELSRAPQLPSVSSLLTKKDATNIEIWTMGCPDEYISPFIISKGPGLVMLSGSSSMSNGYFSAVFSGFINSVLRC